MRPCKFHLDPEPLQAFHGREGIPKVCPLPVKSKVEGPVQLPGTIELCDLSDMDRWNASAEPGEGVWSM